MINIRDAYKTVKTWAQNTAFRNNKILLAEAADFGEFFGFAFKVTNIYNNAYWCVNKKDLKLFLFLPVQNPKAFIDRKKINKKRVY